MKDKKTIQRHLNFSFITKKMSFLAKGFTRVDQRLSFLATAKYMIFKSIDFLHKSKKLSGFLGETKPNTAAYIDVREEHRQVPTTESPTSLSILNRYLLKLAYAEEFVGGSECRTASSTENVREDSSLEPTPKLPAEVEFRKISNALLGYFSWIPTVARMTSFLSWRNSIIYLFILLLSNISIANEALPTKKIAWSFDGVLGSVDRKAAQRGFQVYKEVCSSCHGLYNLYYRNLKYLGFSDEEIKEIAKNYTVQDGPNDAGEMFERPALPSDPFVRPYPNEQAARAANNGANPPDLSLIIKARPDGANYLYSILTGYSDPPENFKLMPGLNYNPYFPHSQIAMPAPLTNRQVKYIDGTNSSVEQMAMDVTTFLQWAAEPEMENRKSMGLKVMMFLVIFIIFFYISKNKIWKNLETEEHK